MRFVIQVVDNASVNIDSMDISRNIKAGFLLFVGIGKNDDKVIADKMVKKLLNLRVFKDENGKINYSLLDVSGELLVISQFTLYADCCHGNRPNFLDAAAPEDAENLYNYLVEEFSQSIAVVKTGEFGAAMKVSLTNNGPYTIVLDSDIIFKK